MRALAAVQRRAEGRFSWRLGLPDATMVRAAIDALGGDAPAHRPPSAPPAGVVELGQADPSAKLPIRRLAAE